jgi:hypothetical protein
VAYGACDVKAEPIGNSTLAVGVCLSGLSDDFAMQIIQRGKEGDLYRCDSNRGFGWGYALCPAADPVGAAVKRLDGLAQKTNSTPSAVVKPPSLG